MTWAIHTSELTKSFSLSAGIKGIIQPRCFAEPAVDQVNLTVNEGEIFGLLGPNGAGKTTLIKLLCTLIHPTAGDARIFRYPLQLERNIKNLIGLVTSEERSSNWRLTGGRT